ncbi:DUF2867 domain-containing protein [Mumia zhuanghuii]|nr:DUF2867 domain-containing protein [Mumia zhuanghuii]
MPGIYASVLTPAPPTFYVPYAGVHIVDGDHMRISRAEHLNRAWRIHELLSDFTLEDVWAQPEISGPAADFERVVRLATASNPAKSPHGPTRFLWQVRDLLGRWFDLGGISAPHEPAGLAIPGTAERTLAGRLPWDLIGTADGVRFEHLPFVPLYLTADEFAAEISNKTVHGVMHLGWVPRAGGSFHAQMAVYVKPRGLLGDAYMAFIRPFRYLIVYPALERQSAKTWRRDLLAEAREDE